MQNNENNNDQLAADDEQDDQSQDNSQVDENENDDDDDDDDEEQLENEIQQFYDNALEEEKNDANEYEYFCEIHHTGFDTYDTYRTHLIKYDPIIAHRKGIANYFCRFCRRVFVKPQNRDRHQLRCPANPQNARGNQRRRRVRLASLARQIRFNLN